MKSEGLQNTSIEIITTKFRKNRLLFLINVNDIINLGQKLKQRKSKKIIN